MYIQTFLFFAALSLSSASIIVPVVTPEVIVSTVEIPVLPKNYELILPPVAAELPCGLGYSVAGAPLVSGAFSSCGYGSLIPLTSPCSCTKLATPLCPELRRFAKPILL